MSAGLVDIVQMAKRSIKLEVQVKESDWKLRKTERKLQVASGAVMEAQHFALSKSGEASIYSQQLEGVEEQLDLAHSKTISI